MLQEQLSSGLYNDIVALQTISKFSMIMVYMHNVMIMWEALQAILQRLIMFAMQVVIY